MKKSILVLTMVAMVLFFGGLSCAEHPGTSMEHPGTHTAEHPGEEAALSAADVISGIKEHIDEVAGKNNGYYPLYDAQEKKSLRLKLLKVHEDRVSYIKKSDAYFACTDFVTEDGKTTYDIDFWMKKTFDGKLKIYQKKIHKKDGSPRFTYRDDEIIEVK